MPNTDKGRILLTLARNAIAQRLGAPTRPLNEPDWLNEPGAAFVTLTQHGQLRGCIGSLTAQRPLGQDVAHNAQAAAFHDPRFPALDLTELDATRVEVSLLSPQQALQFRDEADALARLRPGIDGVVLECGRHRATFLPQVWEQLPQPGEFIGQLKLKAGLPATYWSPAIRLQRYTVEKWKE